MPFTPCRTFPFTSRRANSAPCLVLIAGLEDATTGTITINGRDVTDLEPADRRIAMVFQSYALYPHMTVAEDIASMPRPLAT